MICENNYTFEKNKPHQTVWLSTQIGRDNPTKGGVINELAARQKKYCKYEKTDYNYFRISCFSWL